MIIKNRGDYPVTVFKSVMAKNGEKPSKVITLSELFVYHTDDDDLKEATTELRALKKSNKEAYKVQRKKQLFAFVAGSWISRGELKERIPLLLFDIDGGNEATYLLNLKRANRSRYIYRMEQSTGCGSRLYVFADFTKENRKEVYQAIAVHLASIFELPVKADIKISTEEHIDTATVDETRMWFVAHTDPDLVYHNEESQVWTMPTKPLAPAKEKDNKRERKYNIEFTEEEKIKDIIEQIRLTGKDITQGVEIWFTKVLLPLANHYGEAGRSLVHDISRFHRDYQEQATDKEFDRAIAKDKGVVTIGSFLSHAKSHGIQYDVRRIINARKKVPASPGKKKAFKGMKIVAASEVLNKEMPPPNSKDLEIQDGRYYCSNGRKGKEPVSNFLITPLYLLRDSKAPKRVMQCTNIYGDSTVICCPVKALSNNNEFAALVEGRGNFVPSWTGSQFSAIKEYLYRYEETAEEITVLGHQTDTNYYAFSNGIFDGNSFYHVNEYGIVTISDNQYYLPAFSKVNEDAQQEYHNERKFIFQKGSTSFSSWSRQLISVFGSNAIIGICYVVAAIFRDIVFSHANSFPLLFLFGPKGTGKTTFRNAMHRLFGNYGHNDAIGLGSASSPKGFARKLAQVRNGLQAFEEYKNKINAALIEMLKNIFDGIGYERAQTSNDNRTHATLVNSAVILGGQEMPTKENALFSRVIMLVFDKTKFSDNEKLEYGKLEKSISEGLGGVLLEVVKYRDKVAEEFGKEYAIIYGHLRKDQSTNHMEERTLSNVAAILAPFKILSEDLDFPFNYTEVYQLMRERIKAQDKYMAKTNEVNQFWSVLNALDGKKINKGENYEIKDDILFIDLDRIFETYRDSAFRQDINALDKTTLRSYLAMQPYYKRPHKGENRITLRTDGVRPKQIRCLMFQIKGMESLELDFLA